jgi:hypothetical protein
MLHWDLEDPAEVEGPDEDKLDAFRHTRTEIADRLRPFVEQARAARAAREVVALEALAAGGEGSPAN